MEKQVRLILLIFVLAASLFSVVPQIQADPGGWVSPTSFEDPDSWWTDETKSYDGNMATYALSITTMATCNTAGYLVLFLDSAIQCDKIRIYLHGSYVDDIEIDVYKDGSWESVLDGGTLAPQFEWREYVFVEGSVEKARIRFHTGGTGYPTFHVDYLAIHEFEFLEVSAGPTEYTFHGTVNSQFTVTQTKTVTFSRYSLINQTVSPQLQFSHVDAGTSSSSGGSHGGYVWYPIYESAATIILIGFWAPNTFKYTPLINDKYTVSLWVSNPTNTSQNVKANYWLSPNPKNVTLWEKTATWLVSANTTKTVTLSYHVSQQGNYIAAFEIVEPGKSNVVYFRFTARIALAPIILLVAIAILVVWLIVNLRRQRKKLRWPKRDLWK